MSERPPAFQVAAYPTPDGWRQVDVRLEPRPEDMPVGRYWEREVERLRRTHPELRDAPVIVITDPERP